MEEPIKTRKRKAGAELTLGDLENKKRKSWKGLTLEDL